MRSPWVYRNAANRCTDFQSQAESNAWEQCCFDRQKEFREVCRQVGPKRWPLTPQYRLEEQDVEDPRFCELKSAQQEAAYALYFTEEESTC